MESEATILLHSLRSFFEAGYVPDPVQAPIHKPRASPGQPRLGAFPQLSPYGPYLVVEKANPLQWALSVVCFSEGHALRKAQQCVPRPLAALESLTRLCER